jgi:hypothetical protein
VHLEAGETKTVNVTIKVSDFARYDPQQLWTDMSGSAVAGAYVVDSGEHVLFVGGCVSVGAVWDDSRTCTTLPIALDLGTPSGTPSNAWVYL